MRIAVRYRQVYAVFPRGYSKSFLAVLSLMIRCILYPGSKLFTSAGGKSQSASILKEKVEVEVPKPLNWWQKLRISLGETFIGAFILFIGYLIFIKKKKKL